PRGDRGLPRRRARGARGVTPLLELNDVVASYGPVKALHGISLTVDEGAIVAVLGANGAGKTTTLRAISHTVRRSGEIRFAGRSLARCGPETIASLGIAHVPEGRGLVPELNHEGMTVLVVEQNAHIALQLAGTAYVLEVGTVALRGPSADLERDESVRRSYLGY